MDASAGAAGPEEAANAEANFKETITLKSKDNNFALPGDSGALVVTDDGRVGGMIIAVNPVLRRTFACKASNIAKLLDVSFELPPSWRSTKPSFDPSAFPTDPKDRFEVLIGGISIGHRDTGAGTLGGIVWDNATGEPLCLTCAHVAAPFGAKLGDAVYQPGPLDIRARFGREPDDNDVAGHLVRWIPISFTEPNLVDAALFRPIRPFWPGVILGLSF